MPSNGCVAVGELDRNREVSKDKRTACRGVTWLFSPEWKREPRGSRA